MATLSEIVQKVIVRISQVPGTGVQLYAEDRIAQMIQEIFDMAFEDYWWPQFYYESTFTLDGTNGLITGNIANNIKRYQDIQYMFFNNDTQPMKEKPASYNPSLVVGSHAYMFQPYNDVTKVFQVLPKTSVGVVTVIGRTKPADFNGGDEVLFDTTALVLGAARDYLEDDAANPGAIDKFEQMFEARIRQLKNSLDQHPRILDPRIGRQQDEWMER